jgi:transcriptional regulator
MHSFGQLTSHVDGQIFASHLPLLLSDDGKKLLGHLARANPQWSQLEDQQVLVVFQGPHSYVSPSWYSQPGVPTWNYQAVHVYGHVQCLHDSERLRQIVEELTRINESGFDSPWQTNYDIRQLQGIVGLEIEIEQIQCKYKLSQNRQQQERTDVADQLENLGELSLAAAMKDLDS